VRLIDIHRHLWDLEWFPPAHRMQFAVRAAARRYPMPDPQTILPRVGREVYDPDGSAMIQQMDDLGIDVSVIMVLDWGIRYMSRGEPDAPLPIAEINRRTLSLRQKYPGRVFGFAGVDPRRKGALQLLEVAVKEWGAIGYKPYPPNGYYANDPMLMPFYEKCCQLNIPVLVHCGGYGWAIPDPLEEIAEQFPDLQIIMGHANLQGRFESGTYWRGIQVAATAPNIVLDLTDWQVLGTLEEHNIAEFWHVFDVMRNTVGAHRIVFGTDMPIAGKGYELTRRWCEMFRNLPEEAAQYGVRVTPAEADLICHGNAERLLPALAPTQAAPASGL
jgi:predicted TIM-barrel fold metal-dependent hydrolase